LVVRLAFWVEHKGKLLIAMPGVPAEMKAMFEAYVLKEIESRLGEKKVEVVSRTLKCVGIGESALNERISDLLKNLEGR